jgi:hypothetical protein
MKKTLLTIAIVLGMTVGAMAQPQGGGMFQRGAMAGDAQESSYRNSTGLILPNSHGENTDQSGTPLGSGIAVLLGLGSAYLMAKKTKED